MNTVKLTGLLTAIILSGCVLPPDSSGPKTTSSYPVLEDLTVEEALGSDNDGVIVSKDDCPDTDMNTLVDTYGCPTHSGHHCDDKDQHLKQFSYATGKSELKNSDLAAIAQVVKEYRDMASYSKFKDKQLVFHIESHTSKNEVANELALSTARAEAIKQVLIEQFGIDPSLIKTQINTSANPIAPNDAIEGRLLNQRAYLTFSLDPI